jgi:hypothetical protein
MEKAEKDILQGLGHVVGRVRVCTQLILSHPQGTDLRYRFKKTKEQEAGDKKYA